MVVFLTSSFKITIFGCMKLVFATHNLNKFAEVEKLVPAHIALMSLTDIGCTNEIPETGKTLEANARIKADYVTQN